MRNPARAARMHTATPQAVYKAVRAARTAASARRTVLHTAVRARLRSALPVLPVLRCLFILWRTAARHAYAYRILFSV